MSKEEEVCVRCLTDAGLDQTRIRQYFHLVETGQAKEANRLLKSWRGELLDELHASQKRLDCLDYFLRKIQGNTPIER